MIKNKIKTIIFTTMFTLFTLQQANGMLSEQVHQIIDNHTISLNQNFDTNIQSATNAINRLNNLLIQALQNSKTNPNKINFWNIFFQSILTKLEKITNQEKTSNSSNYLAELDCEIQRIIALNINTGILLNRFKTFRNTTGINTNPNTRETQNILPTLNFDDPIKQVEEEYVKTRLIEIHKLIESL